MTTIIKQNFQHLCSFIHNYERSQKNRPDEFQNTVLTYLEKIEQHFQREVNVSLGSLIKKSAIKTLTILENTLDHTQLQKIEEIKERILIVRELVLKSPQKASIEQKKLINKPKIGLKLGIFSDIDSPDHNGAITGALANALKAKIPCITTRSLLCSVDLKKEAWEALYSQEIRVELCIGTYDIFQQFDPLYGEELILLLPKTLLPDLLPEEKLAALDFVANGTIKKITASEALQPPKGKSSVEALRNMFNPRSTLNKVFFLDGHGNDKYVGGLEQSNYLKLLDLVEEQRGKGLMIVSCSSGGKSSMINFPALDKPLNFAVIVHSIGDFTTFNASSPIAAIDAFAWFLENQPETFSELRSAIESLGDSKKLINNCIKAYFPHSASIPGGFRPLGEHGIGFPVTFIDVKASEILHTPLIIPKTQFIEINPSVIPLSIVFTESNPILLSMIPGLGRHFIGSIELAREKESPSEYLQRCQQFYKDTEVKKGFFVKKIANSTSKIEDAAILFDKWGGSIIFKEEGKYYFINGSSAKTEISPLVYALFATQILTDTKADEQAITSLSCGHESDAAFLKVFQKNKFIASDVFEKLFDKKDPDVNQILSEKISSLELQEILFFLMQNGYADTAMKLWQEKQFAADLRNIRGNPLIIATINFGSLEMLDALLNQSGQDADALSNMRSPSLHSLLVYGLNSSDQKLTKLLRKGVRLPSVLSARDREYLQKHISKNLKINNIQLIKQLIDYDTYGKHRDFFNDVVVEQLLTLGEGHVLLKECFTTNVLSMGEVFLHLKEKQKKDSNPRIEQLIAICKECLRWHAARCIASHDFFETRISIRAIESFCHKLKNENFSTPITDIIMEQLLVLDEEEGKKLLKYTFDPNALPVRDIYFRLKKLERTDKFDQYIALCRNLIESEKREDFYI